MAQLLEIEPSTESRHELLTWLNTTMPSTAPNGSSVAPMHKVEQCGNGVPYVVIAANILPIVYAPLTSSSSSKIKIPAQHDFEAVANLKLLQDALQRNSIARPEVMINEMPKLIKGNFQANLQLLQWFKGLYDTLLRREGVAQSLHSDPVSMLRSSKTNANSNNNSNNSNNNNNSSSAHKKTYPSNVHTSSSSSSAGITAATSISSTNPSASRRTHAQTASALSQPLTAAAVGMYSGAAGYARGRHTMTLTGTTAERVAPIRPISAARTPSTQTVHGNVASIANTHRNNHATTVAAAAAAVPAGVSQTPPRSSSPSSASWACAALGTSPAHDQIQGQDDDIADAWRECETINAQGNAATAAAMEILYPSPQHTSNITTNNNYEEDKLNTLIQLGNTDDLCPPAEDAVKCNTGGATLNDAHIADPDETRHGHNIYTQSTSALRDTQATPLIDTIASRAQSHMNSRSTPSQHRREFEHTTGGSTAASPTPLSALRSRATRRRMLQEASDRRRAGTPLLQQPASRQVAANALEDAACAAGAAEAGQAQSRRANSLSQTWESQPQQALSRQGTPSRMATSHSFVVSASNARARGQGGVGGAVSAARVLHSSLGSSFVSQPATGRVVRAGDAAVARPRANRPFIQKGDAHSNANKNTNNNNNSDINVHNESSNLTNAVGGDASGSSIYSANSNNHQSGSVQSGQPTRTPHPAPSHAWAGDSARATGAALGQSGTAATITPKRGFSTPVHSSAPSTTRRTSTGTLGTAGGGAAAAQHAAIRSGLNLRGASGARRVNAKPHVALSSSTSTPAGAASAASGSVSAAAARGFALTHPASANSVVPSRAASAAATRGTRSRVLAGRNSEWMSVSSLGTRPAARSVRPSNYSSTLAYTMHSGVTHATSLSNTSTLRPASALTVSALPGHGAEGGTKAAAVSLIHGSPLLSQPSPSPAARAPPSSAVRYANHNGMGRAVTAEREGEDALHGIVDMKRRNEQTLSDDLVSRRLSTERAQMASTPRLMQGEMGRQAAAGIGRVAGDGVDELVEEEEDATVVARERQFYYDKLREIELIVAPFRTHDGDKGSAAASVTVDQLIEYISSVLYRDY